MHVSRELYVALYALGVVACHEVGAPSVGAIRVLTATAGVDLDVDGYGVSVDDADPQPIQVNGSLILSDIRAGNRRLRLSGVSANCAMQSPASLSVSVAESDTVDATFALECAVNVGTLYVQMFATGADLDASYLVSIDGEAPIEISGTGGSLGNARAGSHTLTLSGLDSNCGAQVPTQTVIVVFGQQTLVPFLVTCIARTGGLQIQTTTTGVDNDDFYTVDVPQYASFTVPANGSLLRSNIHEGTSAVTLSGVTPNCTVAGTNPRTVTITFGQITPLGFDVSCTAFAKLRVAATTTGVDLDPSFTVRVQGGGFSQSASVASQGTVTIAGMVAGDYTVALEDVTVNCQSAAGSQNPRTVQVTSGNTTDLAFDIVCGPAGQIAFVRSGNGPDLAVMKANGTLVAPLTTDNGVESKPAYSRDGSRIAFEAYRGGKYEIYVMNADGTAPTRLADNEFTDLHPTWSADGARIAFQSTRDENDEIWVMNADGSSATRLTFDAAFDGMPAWSPDGTRIAFVSTRSGTAQIWVMNADGSNPARLTNTPSWDGLPAWSPDGARIAFVRDVECDDYYSYCHNVFVMNADGSNVVRLETRSHDSAPAWSPDGKWIAFETHYCDYYTCGANSISAVRPDGSGRTVILTGEVYQPAWRP